MYAKNMNRVKYDQTRNVVIKLYMKITKRPDCNILVTVRTGKCESFLYFEICDMHILIYQKLGKIVTAMNMITSPLLNPSLTIARRPLPQDKGIVCYLATILKCRATQDDISH